jgi:butyryl-CoA dehydrogenase
MNFTLSDEQNMLIQMIRNLGEREKFKELAKKVDETCEFPTHLIPLYSKLGLLGMTLSPKYGGGGQPLINAIIAIEELAKFSPMIAAPVFESCVGPIKAVDLLGTEEQKQRLIPGVCSGEYSVSASMTEPEAGSDLTALRTNAIENGNHYILNGQKCFITGGGHASHYLVYTRFNQIQGYKGIGCLIAEKGMAGFSFGKQEKFMGLRGMPSCDLVFEDVHIPKENLLLAPGEFNRLMATFHIERCGNAAMCIGIASAALEEAKKYASERLTFGKPICEFQSIQFMVVDMTMKLDAAKLLLYRAAENAGGDLPSIYEASLAKAYANEMVIDVTNLAMQIFGGYGYSCDFSIERMYRDAKAWGVAGGTIQMLKIGIAGILFGRRFNQRN